jgi:hypothetical protein
VPTISRQTPARTEPGPARPISESVGTDSEHNLKFSSYCCKPTVYKTQAEPCLPLPSAAFIFVDPQRCAYRHLDRPQPISLSRDYHLPCRVIQVNHSSPWLSWRFIAVTGPPSSHWNRPTTTADSDQLSTRHCYRSALICSAPDCLYAPANDSDPAHGALD